MDYQDRNTIERAAQTIADGLRQQPATNIPSISHAPVDLNPIAEAIRDGLTAIGTAIEYAAQMREPLDVKKLAAELLTEADRIAEEEEAKGKKRGY